MILRKRFKIVENNIKYHITLISQHLMAMNLFGLQAEKLNKKSGITKSAGA
jgi:hypothetical protein